MTLNKSLYTRLLKQKKVSRKEINKKKNLDKKRAIIRELVQYYNSNNLSRTQVLKSIRQHGIKIPKDISSNPYEFAGIRKFGAKEEEYNRKLIKRIQRLKGTTIPIDKQAFPSKSFNKGEYVWIISYTMADGTNRSSLIMTDKLVSRNMVQDTIDDMMLKGVWNEEEYFFMDSPPMSVFAGNLDVMSWAVVGLMRGTA